MNLDPAQHFRHVAAGDAQRQPFDHGGLADPRFAGQNRIVLAPPHQDVDRLADFAVATDHRIELAGPRARRQAGGELVQCRRLVRRAPIQFRHRVARSEVAGGARWQGFVRTTRELVEVVLEAVDCYLREQLRAALGQLRQVGRGQQGQQQVTAADLVRPGAAK